MCNWREINELFVVIVASSSSLVIANIRVFSSQWRQAPIYIWPINMTQAEGSA